MIWLVWIDQLIMIVLIFLVLREVRHLRERLRKMDIASRVRQGTIARQRTSVKNPIVDSHARTTKRDTNDLPLTGRMSQGVHRKKTNDRHTNDDGLQPGSGLPPTSDG